MGTPTHCIDATCSVPLIPELDWRAGDRPEGAKRHGGRGLCTACAVRYRRHGINLPELITRKRRNDPTPPRVAQLDLSWQDEAACAGLHPNVFYPPDGLRGRQRAAWEAVAKRICRGCPVQDACLEHALRHYELGIWGGTTEDDRKAARAKVGAA